MYISIFFHPACPPNLSLTHARRTFDRALRTLPPSLHARIWTRYLLLSERKGGVTAFSVYRRYLSVDPSLSERYVALLLNPVNAEPRPLEAAKLLLQLARNASKGQYISPEGKSPYQLLESFIDVVEKFSEQVGLDVEETLKSNQSIAEADSLKEVSESASVNGSGANTNDTTKTVDPDEDPLNPRKFNIEDIIKKDGLGVYKDQAGRLWVGLATYWIKRAEFDRAKHTFEAGLSSVLTVRDFNQIFDSYGEFGQSLMDALMESLKEEEDDEEIAETEKELDQQMKDFEDLADRRPFLLNDVMIRRNPNDVQEWEKRVALWGEDDEKVAETYTQAFETINPRKATPNFHRLYIAFARFYEEGGVSGKAEPDLQSARKILEKATKVNFRAVDDLAEIWCEWAEMELRHEYVPDLNHVLSPFLTMIYSNDDEAIRVMQRAAAVPKNTKINYHDHVCLIIPNLLCLVANHQVYQSLSVQARLFKSLKLWSFYVDLEEAIGTVESAKAVYDKILELRIANAQIIVNYAAFLEENKYFEESFKVIHFLEFDTTYTDVSQVYERGVELFTFPVSFEIWNIYLSKFIKRYVSYTIFILL